MTHQPKPAFAATSGPRKARIAVVGEAWGKSEALLGRPFVGASGQEFLRMMVEAWGIDPGGAKSVINGMYPDSGMTPETLLSLRELWLGKAELFLTNVFSFRPPDNNIEALCGKKAEVGGESYALPPLKQGKYFFPEFLPELDRLEEELREVAPNIIIALGNTACWALLRSTKIGSIRGAVAQGVGPFAPWKVLPTYHPAGVLRNWSWRTIVICDLMKAERESHFPELIRPERRVLVHPTVSEIEAWCAKHIFDADPALVSCDTETAARQISDCGFAVSASESMVATFMDASKPGGNFFENAWDEAQAWKVIREVLEGPWPKLFQNGSYDLQYFARMGFRPRNCLEDTMLFHHALYPELQKGLGFLGSIYTNEAAWKLMRLAETTKRDE